MSNPTPKVAHLTSVHPRNDTRIFIKICSSLVSYGYDTTLIVADGEGDQVINGVQILDVGRRENRRILRMFITAKKVYEAAKHLEADIYHIHDPELIPIGLMLKRLGKKVIFDSHEDLPKQVLSKPYLPKPLRYPLSKVVGLFERYTCYHFSGVVCATPFIRSKLEKVNAKSIDINNFPKLNELSCEAKFDWTLKDAKVCYVGNISRIRGIENLVEALMRCKTDVRLQLVGEFSEKLLEDQMYLCEGWEKIDSFGFLDRSKVRDVLQKSVAGIVTFLPLPNHVNAQPNKMFEYMSAGIPVIASNFPLWREIIEGQNCGICVDPDKPQEIAEAIDYLIRNPASAEEMGKNGRYAVTQYFNWEYEENKLLSFYKEITLQ